LLSAPSREEVLGLIHRIENELRITVDAAPDKSW